jgi:hypothetical protein
VGVYDSPYRDKKVVGVFVRFRAPLRAQPFAAGQRKTEVAV